MNVAHIFQNLEIEDIVSDKSLFNSFVYTPIKSAILELKKRKKEVVLNQDKNEETIPSPLQGGGLKAVLFRQLFTPNYEFRRFIEIVKFNALTPVFFEYHQDRFSTMNPLKHSLGKMRFEQVTFEKGKRSRLKTIIDFNKSDGKKIAQVHTKNGQSLIDFHHEILENQFPSTSQYLFDASNWFKQQGNAREYYLRYISLFISDAILFENFLLEGHELKFIKQVFLPSFIELWKKTQKKPIIVSLLPVETAGDIHWLSHPHETLTCISNRNMI